MSGFTVIAPNGNKAVVPTGPSFNFNGNVSDATALGTLTPVVDPAFLLVSDSAGEVMRRLNPSGWGLSNLLATVPAGRVPFSDANGLVTSNAGLGFVDATRGLSAGTLTLQPLAGSDANVFRVIHTNGQTSFACDLSSYLTRFGPSGVSVDGLVGNFTTLSGGDIRAASFNQFTITNPTIRWPNASPNLSLVQDSAGVLRVGNGSTGVGSLIAGNLTVRQPGGTAGTHEIQVSHNGTAGDILCPSGQLFIRPTGSGGKVCVGTASTGTIQAGVFESTGAEAGYHTTGVRLNQSTSVNWCAGTFWFGAIDLRIRRSSANVLDVDTGTNSAFADVRLRNLTMSGQSLTTPTTFAWGTNVDVNGGLQGVVIGHGTTPTATRGGGTGAVAIGRDCVTSGGVAIGNTVSTGGSSSIAVGRSISAGVSNGVGVGANITLSGANTTALGTVLTASGACSAAIGSDITATNAGEFAFGTRDNNPSYSGSRFAGHPTTRRVFSIDGSWVGGAGVVDATRAGILTLNAFNVATAQEGLRVEANSGGVRLGFYGATAVGRQTVSAAATDPATTMALVNELRADLIALGLLQ